MDAQTLQLRHRFGRGLLNNAQQLAVAGDELYVCDTNNHRLQVFSLTQASTAARSRARGGRREHLCCVQRTASTSSSKNTSLATTTTTTTTTTTMTTPMTSAAPLRGVTGRRILVLSLQGDILQVVTHPTEPTAEFRSILCFDHKLLARYYYYTESLSPRRLAGFTLGKFGMLALQGL